MSPHKILFICTGNICRSPTAHAVARHKAKISGKENLFIFDSAGTNSFHEGESPDARSVKVAQEKGISFSGIFSRPIAKKDFVDFDFLLCMDRSHVLRLLAICEEKHHHKIKLFLEFCATKNFWDDEVIDPYYGDNKGFEEVFAMIENAVDDMIKILS